MNIGVTGFYGTGSSAIIDLLREYDEVECAIDERYEHYVFLLKDCLFDLGNSLFSESSNYMIVDKSINNFIDEMKRQNKYNFGWYGSYKNLTGNKFMNIVDNFVNEISYTKVLKKNFTQAKGVRFSLIKGVLQVGAAILKGYKIKKFGRVYTFYKNNARRYLKVTKEEFLIHARKFIEDYFALFKSNSVMIYDHLLLPEQIHMVDDYFNEDFRLIVVDRDPRDVYISSKYIWSQVKWGAQESPFVDNIQGFENYWKNTHYAMMSNEKLNKNVLIVNFEDLIYNYDETKKKIEHFCKLDEKKHIKKMEYFNPKESINNTQVFHANPDYENETNEFSEDLRVLYYPFPYLRETKIENVFDK